MVLQLQVEGRSVFVILSLGSFKVHTLVNECKGCASYVVILCVINTADTVCVFKREKAQGGVCVCMCVLTGVF